MSSTLGADPAARAQTNIKLAYIYYQEALAESLTNFNDVAGALTFMVTYANMAREGINRHSYKQVDSVYRQFEKLLLGDPAFLALPDNGKQLMLETVIVDSAAINAVSYSRSEMVRVAEEILAKHLKGKAKNLRITDNGMEF